MPERPVFRNAVSGYNKQDVNAYIVKKDAEYEEKLSVFDKRSKAEILTLTEKLSNAERLAEETVKVNSEASLCVSKFNKIYDRLRESVTEAGEMAGEIPTLLQDCRRLCVSSDDELRVLRALSKKAEAYNKLRALLSDMIGKTGSAEDEELDAEATALSNDGSTLIDESPLEALDAISCRYISLSEKLSDISEACDEISAAITIYRKNLS